uniref:DUF547 domain-containing protein n=1 Tax=Oryza punctata TaxID=4537 RepID=A0A0E0LGL5_ORYPU
MEILEKKGRKSLPKAMKPSNTTAKHNRSKSDLEDKNAKDALCSSLKACNQPKLILQLESHLKDQQVVRGALEKALGPDPDHLAHPVNLSHESPMLKVQPANELIREVATLELEIKHLEQYLLTLYRKAFDQQQQAATLACSDAAKLSVSSRCSQLEETPKAKAAATAAPVRRGGGDAIHYSCPPAPLSKRWNNGGAVDDCSPSTCPRKTMDSSDQCHGLRSQSALSFRGVCSSRISPSEDSLARALRSCHSQPFSYLEEGEAAPSGVVSLADYLGTNVADHIPETPNNLSEEMVRCMAGVYCKLADPPLVHHRASSSPTSSFSSTSVVSPQYLGDMWSPNCRKEATLDSRLINPFRVEGQKEFSGPYNTMVEVPSISRDRRRLREVEDLLQTYKLILYRLETIDLRRMTNDEKIAFWINIHNAMLMHAYLKYGIPQNHLKKTSLLVKAECKIAGRTINAAVIQGLVLGCSTHCPGQVRVLSPKRLSQQLEAAREEYIRATVGVRKEQRVLLPKLVESYARDARLSPERLVDAVQRCLPESLRAAVQRCRQSRPASKVVEWAPYRHSFRYLLARDLAFPHLT